MQLARRLRCRGSVGNETTETLIKSNHFSPKGKELKMTQKMRTEIEDIPEITIELAEEELRIVSGGLTKSNVACSSLNAISKTGGDSDHDDFWAS